MLKVVNLTKKYGTLEVLKGISFEIKKGMIYGFLGQNGAGKTTTMNILTGLINYNDGEIYLDGKLLKNNKRALLRKVGYLPQKPIFYNYMSATEYLHFIGEINNMDKKLVYSRTKEVLDIVNLTSTGNRKIGGYSGGMKQRLGIAVAMYSNPEILILDEPTSALDPEGRLEILELIEALKLKEITVFLSSHILNDIERVCDEVSILNEGKLLVSENLEDLKNKYIQPIYDVEFEKNCDEIRKLLMPLPWIQNVVINKNFCSIYVKDLNKAHSELFKLLGNQNNTIISFNLRKSNLEDIFIRLVNKDGNL